MDPCCYSLLEWSRQPFSANFFLLNFPNEQWCDRGGGVFRISFLLKVPIFQIVFCSSLPVFCDGSSLSGMDVPSAISQLIPRKAS